MSTAIPSLTPTRRETLRLLALIGGGAGLAGTAQADAAPGWPAAAFQQKTEADAVQTLYGKPFEASSKITLDVPEIAENGAVVPVAVSTELPKVTSISLVVPENPFSLAASYRLADGTQASVACRLKMAKTSQVVALVESDGKLYATTKEVKVTLGGCGG